MKRGRAKVLFFHEIFGFIKDIDTKKEYYICYKDIKEKEKGQYKYLKKGELVEYTKDDNSNSNRAVDVLKVNNKDEKNRDIIFVKIFSINGDINVNHIYTIIKTEFGYRHVHNVNDILIACDNELTRMELIVVYDSFKNNKTKSPLLLRKKVIYFD